MRLINVHTRQLSEFWGLDVPPYSILSHCWGPEEVTYQEISSLVSSPSTSTESGYMAKSGYLKINSACLQSSAELSESINSMYKWYENSMVCYALLDGESSHLSVYDSKACDVQEDHLEDKWFTRGWTLQELIAPSRVEFFDKNWKHIGNKFQCSGYIALVTTIPENVIRSSRSMSSYGIATKMSWAAGRQTTRIEDVAYSLLGMFKVNMPLLYGEGKKAFIRLQEEIMKESDDHSLFAWDFQEDYEREPFKFRSVLADNPSRFANSAMIYSTPGYTDLYSTSTSSKVSKNRKPYAMTNKGVQIYLPIFDFESIGMVAMLDCKLHGGHEGHQIVIALQRPPTSHNQTFFRGTTRCIMNFTARGKKRFFQPETSEIYLLKTYSLKVPYFHETGYINDSAWNITISELCLVRSGLMRNAGHGIIQTMPNDFIWDRHYQTLRCEHVAGEWGGKTLVAFCFRHDRDSADRQETSLECVLFLCLQGYTHEPSIKLSSISTLSSIGQNRFKTLFDAEQDIFNLSKWSLEEVPHGYGKYAYLMKDASHHITARVSKDVILDEKCIMIDIGVSEGGFMKFDAEGAVAERAINH
jgi:hypothetical protein